MNNINWHYIKEDGLPEEENKIYLFAYHNETANKSTVLCRFYTKTMNSEGMYAWAENLTPPQRLVS